MTIYLSLNLAITQLILIFTAYYKHHIILYSYFITTMLKHSFLLLSAVLLSLWTTFATSNEFNQDYTKFIESTFADSTINAHTGTTQTTGELKFDITANMPDLDGKLQFNIKTPYTIYTTDTRSYALFNLNATVAGDMDTIRIPNTTITAQIETLDFKYYSYYKINNLNIDTTKRDSNDEELQYIKMMLDSDITSEYTDRWIRVRKSKSETENMMTLPNIHMIKKILLANPIFKHISTTDKGYIISLDTDNLLKIIPSQFFQLVEWSDDTTDTTINHITTITGLLQTGTIPSLSMWVTSGEDMINMTLAQDKIEIKAQAMNTADKIKFEFSMNQLWDQSYKLWLSMNYANTTDNSNFEMLFSDTWSFLLLDHKMKLRTPLNAKTMEQIENTTTTF